MNPFRRLVQVLRLLSLLDETWKGLPGRLNSLEIRVGKVENLENRLDEMQVELRKTKAATEEFVGVSSGSN